MKGEWGGEKKVKKERTGGEMGVRRKKGNSEKGKKRMGKKKRQRMK